MKNTEEKKLFVPMKFHTYSWAQSTVTLCVEMLPQESIPILSCLHGNMRRVV